MFRHLQENSSTLRKSDSAQWKITLITPGQGSSGYYSEEMLREYGASAFPAGTHSYVDHLGESESRSPRDLIGVLTEAATYEEGVGVVGTLKVFPHYTDFIEAVGPHTGMSIYAAAEGREDNGTYVVEKLVPNTFNSIDLVSYAGRGGEIGERLLESARQAAVTTETSVEKTASGPAIAESRTPRMKEINGMDEAVEALSAKVDSLVEGLQALQSTVVTLVEAQTPEVAETEEPEIDFAQVAEQAVTAGLPAEARKVVYESVRNGKAIADAIADQKALVESIKQEFISAGATVRVGESAGIPAKSKDSFFVGRWNG